MKKILDLNLLDKQYTINVDKIVYLSPVVNNGVNCWFWIYFNHHSMQIMEGNSKEYELITLRNNLKRVWAGQPIEVLTL